jgi:hypothetical protein
VNDNQFRQGDVWLERMSDVDQLPEGLVELKRDRGRVILAYGEVTGHAHAIAERNAALFGKPGSDERWLVVRPSGATIETGAGVVVRHEEHAPIALAPGVYRVGRQREYSPSEIKYVAD